METSCKVCGGPHATGACTEKKDGSQERLPDYGFVTLDKIAAHFRSRADISYSGNDNAQGNKFTSIAENLQDGRSSVTDLKRALKELEDQYNWMGDTSGKTFKVDDTGANYGDSTSMDSMIRFLRNELSKSKGK